jgi:hypothetical protein
MTSNESYIEIYANQFNLKQVVEEANILFYEGTEVVSKICKTQPGIFNYRYNGEWTKCKISDLLCLILNNIPAHG